MCRLAVHLQSGASAWSKRIEQSKALKQLAWLIFAWYGMQPQYQDWLHGTMEVTIFEAQHLPGDPTIIPCTPFFINSAVAKIPQCCGKEELAPMPYLTIRVGGVRAAYASSLKRTLHPKWNEKFTFAVAGPVEDVIFQIKVY